MKEDDNKKWFEKPWLWTILTLAFIIVIHTLYTVPAPIKFLYPQINAEDIITFVGAMVLGYVAIVQNRRANDMTDKANALSERILALEENQFHLDIRPFVLVADWEVISVEPFDIFDNAYDDKSLYFCIGEWNEKETLGIRLIYQNTTQSFVTVSYNGADVQSDFCKSWQHSGFNMGNHRLRIPAGDSKEMIFYADKKFILSHKGCKVTLKLILENRFAKRYKESIDLVIMMLQEKSELRGSYFCHISPQNYEIEECETD